MNWNIDTAEGLANAVDWAQRLMNALSDKATWGVPRSGTTIIIDKAAKTATIHSLLPDPSIPRVFKAMGWQVIEQSNA